MHKRRHIRRPHDGTFSALSTYTQMEGRRGPHRVHFLTVVHPLCILLAAGNPGAGCLPIRLAIAAAVQDCRSRRSRRAGSGFPGNHATVPAFGCAVSNLIWQRIDYYLNATACVLKILSNQTLPLLRWRAMNGVNGQIDIAKKPTTVLRSALDNPSASPSSGKT
jgi:hypothetical protein